VLCILDYIISIDFNLKSKLLGFMKMSMQLFEMITFKIIMINRLLLCLNRRNMQQIFQ